MKHLLRALILLVLCSVQVFSRETEHSVRTLSDEDSIINIELKLDGETYQDTVITIPIYGWPLWSNFEYVDSGYIECDTSIVINKYWIKKLCKSHWGDVYILTHEVPSFYYNNFMRGILIDNNGSGNGFALPIDVDTCIDTVDIYKELLDDPEFAPHPLSQLRNITYHKGTEEVFFTMMPLSLYYHTQFISDMGNIILETAKTHVAVLKSDNGRHLRVEAQKQFFVSYSEDSGKEDGREVEFTGEMVIRFSTDSCGNGKFKLEETPLLAPNSVVAISSLTIANNVLQIPDRFITGTIGVKTLLGRQVLQKSITDKSVDLSILPAGFYSIEITHKGHSLHQKVLIR